MDDHTETHHTHDALPDPRPDDGPDPARALAALLSDPDPAAGDPHAPLRSQRDLEAAWRRLLEPLGFRTVTVWLMLIDDEDRAVPHVIQIDHCPLRPTPEDAARFADLLFHLRAEEGAGGQRWAVLRSRPGTDGLSEDDRWWAAQLHAACAAVGVALAPIHIATAAGVRPVVGDDLAGRGDEDRRRVS